MDEDDKFFHEFNLLTCRLHAILSKEENPRVCACALIAMLMKYIVTQENHDKTFLAVKYSMERIYKNHCELRV